MDHIEAISQLDARRDGRLEPQAALALQAHLDHCPDCRLLASRWPAAGASPDLRGRVLAELRSAPRLSPRPARGSEADRAQPWELLPGLWSWPAWGAPLLGAAALLLLLTAFWRPERGWVEADAGFAVTERLGVHSSFQLPGGL